MTAETSKSINRQIKVELNPTRLSNVVDAAVMASGIVVPLRQGDRHSAGADPRAAVNDALLRGGASHNDEVH
jgi:hypothetical protein